MRCFSLKAAVTLRPFLTEYDNFDFYVFLVDLSCIDGFFYLYRL